MTVIESGVPRVSLAEALADFHPDAEFAIPLGWTQGRTAYGGLTAALAVAAAQRTDGVVLPQLRAAQFAFTAPAASSMTVSARRLREGRSVTSVGVETRSGDSIAAHATLIFSAPRDSAVEHDRIARPDVAGPDDCPGLDGSSSMQPSFAGNFERRVAGGAMPVTGTEVPEIIWWVRHRDASGVDPSVALVALGDSLPPAAMTAFSDVAPISTVLWSIDVCDEIADAAGWFLLRSSSIVSRGGYSYQSMEAWDVQGRLVMTGTQTVAIFA
ncbi:thioesterase family protein [Gordonia desulfuricans]|uniref:Thioesterase family protein n=1 Tax=Gordonia desulfuricans TaxID=89051 RepID=A0A7K3LN85_9ACTN|nr:MULTISPECIES: thioesterase family protein [Gordonia]KOY49321.1 acyl-CoA thioesterase [Gordonia sp. NB41Y]NDK89712.1 thioesterase family protein [Gordonia desulfuricans]WLP89716.1 thioesterase family protein [Gordonia sp. NB41Y]